MNVPYHLDIIIPIFNGKDEIKDCLERVIRYSPSWCRIILIDDASTDPEILPFLNHFIKSFPDRDIKLIKNPKNIGFSASVNKGIMATQSDVVLLNSDTKVTKGWIEKILNAAKSNKRCATVTPLTNNGAICSIPEPGKNNPIPPYATIDEYAEFIESISFKTYPQIPSGVGFCMFIKRQVIEEIGPFDEKAYPRGYGEDNDFCCRAYENGYVSILDDSTFIYHQGAISFSNEKKKLIAQNSQILTKRYPWFHKKLYKFLDENPLEDIQQNIKCRLKGWFPSPILKILYILHRHPENDMISSPGGTEIHVKMLIDYCLRNGIQPYIISPFKKGYLLTEYSKSGTNINYYFKTPKITKPLCLEDEAFKKFIKGLIATFSIDIVHIHHLLHFPIKTPEYLSEAGTTVFLTIHDYFLLCPTVYLLTPDYNCCYGDIKETICAKCTEYYRFKRGVPFIEEWRKEVKKQLGYISRIFFPSKNSKELFSRHFTEINKKKSIILPHATIEQKNEVKSFPNFPLDKEAFKILFLGGLTPIKGSRILYDFIKKDLMCNDEQIFILGGIGDPLLNKIINQNNIHFLGSYAPNQVVSIIKKIAPHVVCLLSLAPETFSFTLSEAWLAGCPVLVSNRGALKERVVETGGGWILEDISAFGLRYALDSIKKNPQEYKEVIQKIKKIRLPQRENISHILINEYKTVKELEKKNAQKTKYSNQAKKGYVFNNYELYSAIKAFDTTRHKSYPVGKKIFYKLARISYAVFGTEFIDRIRRNPALLRFIKSLFGLN